MSTYYTGELPSKRLRVCVYPLSHLCSRDSSAAPCRSSCARLLGDSFLLSSRDSGHGRPARSQRCPTELPSWYLRFPLVKYLKPARGGETRLVLRDARGSLDMRRSYKVCMIVDTIKKLPAEAAFIDAKGIVFPLACMPWHRGASPRWHRGHLTPVVHVEPDSASAP